MVYLFFFVGFKCRFLSFILAFHSSMKCVMELNFEVDGVGVGTRGVGGGGGDGSDGVSVGGVILGGEGGVGGGGGEELLPISAW